MLCDVSRPKWAGGLYEGDEHKRLEALHLAEDLGADYVDFELKVEICIGINHSLVGEGSQISPC